MLLFVISVTTVTDQSLFGWLSFGFLLFLLEIFGVKANSCLSDIKIQGQKSKSSRCQYKHVDPHV